MKPMLRRDCLILFAAPAVLRAQAPITLEALAAAQKTPGIAAAIRRRGEEVFSRALGDATPETRFRIGSLSKLLTAATAARLYERGALDLDAPGERGRRDWFWCMSLYSSRPAPRPRRPPPVRARRARSRRAGAEVPAVVP